MYRRILVIGSLRDDGRKVLANARREAERSGQSGGYRSLLSEQSIFMPPPPQA
jgi:hypothetical protein